MKDKKLTPAAKLLYGEIRALEQGKIGLCTATIERLAFETGLGKRTVIRALEQLESEKMIERSKDGRKNTITTKDWSTNF